MRIDEVEARRRSPMSEQPRLDMLGPQRLAQQRIVEQINLADRQIVGGAPVTIQEFLSSAACGIALGLSSPDPLGGYG